MAGSQVANLEASHPLIQVCLLPSGFLEASFPIRLLSPRPTRSCKINKPQRVAKAPCCIQPSSSYVVSCVVSSRPQCKNSCLRAAACRRWRPSTYRACRRPMLLGQGTEADAGQTGITGCLLHHHEYFFHFSLLWSTYLVSCLCKHGCVVTKGPARLRDFNGRVF